MDTAVRRGGSMLVIGLGVLAYNVVTGVPLRRLIGPEGLFTSSGSIYSPFLSYVFAVVLVVVGASALYRRSS